MGKLVDISYSDIANLKQCVECQIKSLNHIKKYFNNNKDTAYIEINKKVNELKDLNKRLCILNAKEVIR